MDGASGHHQHDLVNAAIGETQEIQDTPGLVKKEERNPMLSGQVRLFNWTQRRPRRRMTSKKTQVRVSLVHQMS